MDPDALRRSGKVLERALRNAFRKIDSGERSGLAVADSVEQAILEEARNAFPCNVGVDHVAAHFSPTDTETADFSSGKLVKIDAGAHVDGWISDAAFTYVLDDFYVSVARAAYEALSEAVHAIRPGMQVSEIGKVISDVAKKYGVRPISNLGGHEIKRYNLHAGLFIPNVPEGRAVIEEGMQIAIEPFMTDGRGYVNNGPSVTIFSLQRARARTPLAKKVLSHIEKEYGPLPFAQKWIEREFGLQGRMALFELAKLGSLHQYPILMEQKGAAVGQFETTVVVEPDGAEILIDVFDLVSW
ncbi:MAG: methionyl aminopeptidase [Candidatus Diapherotrites archaeon]|nr:methionyl aminopeptidase [Candidatus Diapherotrites archaeon]MDN5366802.1 methionyl aminopeptidase [Candidatus Diapherotrites archaeon]